MDETQTGDGSAKAPSAKVASFPVVAIGASAGGLEALRQLFAHIPDDTGMAFIVVQHLDPGRPSMLTNVLASDSRMPVLEVADGMRAEPNRVHVIPSGSDLSIRRGILTLVPRQLTRNMHLPIDSFFRSLADDQPGRAIGVVLSGSAFDGTEGLRAIKAAGGITFAQEPESAQFPSMPESAIAAGVVDFRLSAEAIASELARLSRHPYLVATEVTEAAIEDTRSPDEKSVSAVLVAIRQHAQLDFTGYKRPTIMRRIARRMALRRLGSLDEYAESLRDDAGEARALAQDILIHVTSFFRDRSAFDALKQHAFPEMVADKDGRATIRVWVPGCSTGEEAYSIAIALLEFLAGQNQTPDVKIFGSDLSDRAIETARAGLYAESDLAGVSPERLARFFEREEGRYRIGKQVRDLCVFVRHDLTRDPPFAKLDLISCRNVLIYFDAELQQRIIPLLHHCLNKPGYLLLGSSEAVTGFADLFASIDKEQRLFLKRGESPRLAYPVAFGREAESKLPSARHPQHLQPARDAQKQADLVLLARYAPPGVVVNERMEVVQFRGRTGEFLEQPPGQPQMNVLKMARDGLVAPLHEALETARAQAATVRKQWVRVTDDAETRVINLEVVPLAGAAEQAERYFLVIFEEVAARDAGEAMSVPASARAAPSERVAAAPNEDVARLKAELITTRQYLQAITGEHQDTTEELAATNEELVAANEELQSTNEELQSAKEELQSTNEELVTVNDELRSRNQQLDVVANDLVNVLESVQIPMIMVDRELHVRRFTPTAREISSLLPGDVGRSFDDVKLKVKVEDLTDRIRQTIESITPKELEVQGLDGRWFRLHIRPYRTADHRLEGAVLSFLDIDVLKHAVQDAERSRDYAQGIIETVPMSLLVIDANGRIVLANTTFYRNFVLSPNATERAGLFELADGAWNTPVLRETIERSMVANEPFRDREIQCRFQGGDRRDLLIAGCPIHAANGDLMILLAIDDITERRMLEASEKQARIEAEQANRAKDLFLATLSHELRTPLSTILMSAQVLESSSHDDPKIQRASAAIGRAVGNQTRLIDDLLDISRIVSGKLMLDLQAVDLATVVQSAVDVVGGSAEAKGIQLELAVKGSLGPVHGDPVRLQQVVTNLLNNSVKFTPRDGKISVSLEASDGQARIVVSDTGIGLRPEIIPHLFNRFVQAESSMTRAHGGLGLGLAIVRHIVNVHGGEVHAESPGERQGATFTVTLPLAMREVMPATMGRRAVARSIDGIRVLLVEDDDDTREASATMIEELGADVRAVPSAAEGLAAVETFKPEVILCDIAMPGEDGYAFIRKLRKSDGRGGGQIPAAALTALAGEDDRRRALEAGFQMHLAKPIDAERLATAIGTLSVWPRF
ncbi:MAG: chemotaxis protein CheB [Vicinamibacterales bacterium]